MVQSLLLGEIEVVIVGGAELMSCGLYLMFVVRWGACLGDV